MKLPAPRRATSTLLCILLPVVLTWATEPRPMGPFAGEGCSSVGNSGDAAPACAPTTYGPIQPPTPCSICGSLTRHCNCLANSLQHVARPLRSCVCTDQECGCRRRITGIDSATCTGAGEPDWGMRGPIPWEAFAQGEYIGPARTRHMDVYRLRVDDEIQFVFRVTRERTPQAYELNIGDEIRVESVADDDLDRRLTIQPDGTITLRLLGQVIAAGRTTDELRLDLDRRYAEYYQEPSITVTPEKVNTKLEDLRATVDSRAGNGGQSFTSRVIPDGTIQLPAIGSVAAHGLTLDELAMEINARYKEVVSGIEVTPTLRERALRYFYVVGEVGRPGRITMVGPTTVMQGIALAEGWRNGANLRHIVVFRRAEDWRLLATKVDVQGALYGRRPAPSDEIWLRDSDVVVVPKSPVRTTGDAIELIFTQGFYRVVPLSFTLFFGEGNIL